jgi:hypothetical protein
MSPGTRQVRWIGRVQTVELLASAPTAADRAPLLRLLRLAAAPAQPAELVGWPAVAATFMAAATRFTATERGVTVTPGPTGRARRPVLSWALMVKAATGLAVLLLGGTAVAAGTGMLPAAMQHRVHDLLSAVNVPVPDAKPTTSGSRTDTGTSGGPPTNPPAATPAAADTAGLFGLCQAWQAHHDGQGKPIDSAAQRALASAAGGLDRLPEFCASVLSRHPGGQPGHDPSAPPTQAAHPTPPVPTPSHPGRRQTRAPVRPPGGVKHR